MESLGTEVFIPEWLFWEPPTWLIGETARDLLCRSCGASQKPCLRDGPPWCCGSCYHV